MIKQNAATELRVLMSHRSPSRHAHVHYIGGRHDYFFRLDLYRHSLHELPGTTQFDGEPEFMRVLDGWTAGCNGRLYLRMNECGRET